MKMVAGSKILELLPDGYGYVMLTFVDSIFVNMWLARNVIKARKEYNVLLPKLYSPDNDKFNCIQRAHQQTLEMYPGFLALLFLGGLAHPRVTAAAGCVYLAGRIVFAYGYYTGDPAKRTKGQFGFLGLIVMLGSTVCGALQQLRWTPKGIKYFH